MKDSIRSRKVLKEDTTLDSTYPYVRRLTRNNRVLVWERAERCEGILMVSNCSVPHIHYKKVKPTRVSKTFKLDSRSVDGKGYEEKNN